MSLAPTLCPTWSVGVVMVPGTPQLSANDIKYRISASQAKCVFADSTAAEKLDEVLASFYTLCARFA